MKSRFSQVTTAVLLASILTTGCGRSTRSTTQKVSSSRPKKEPTKVILMRTPNGGIQPQAAVDADGRIHLIYFKGNPRAGNLFYVSKAPSEEQFSKPIRVNTTPESAIAIGNVRGAHLSLGAKNQVHVAWMGSQKARTKKTANQSPMLYTRLNEKRDAFEPERNVISKAYGLDGGGSIAADEKGNVYVVWHAPTPGKRGEEHRRIWVAHSKDGGQTFASETSPFEKETGVCGCCGIRAWVDRRGTLYVLYRSATKQVDRDIYLVRSSDHAKSFLDNRLDTWAVTVCPMSTMGFAEHDDVVLACWETEGQVLFAKIDSKTGKTGKPVSAPRPRKRKHPVVTQNSKGETLFAWTEGMGWNRGGSMAWQLFDKQGRSQGPMRQKKGIPVWSVLSAVTLKDGDFLLVW